jgi:hypothetical protein
VGINLLHAPGGKSAIGKRERVALSIALLLALVVVTATGFMATALGVSQFLPHRYASYVLIALVAVHVVLYRRSLVAHARGRPRDHSVSATPLPRTR